MDAITTITNLTQIIVNNIYHPLLNLAMENMGYKVEELQIVEDNHKIHCQICQDNIFIGTFSLWFKTCRMIRYHEMSYKSESATSYDDGDSQSGFIIHYAEGIQKDKIDISALHKSFIEMVQRIDKYEKSILPLSPVLQKEVESPVLQEKVEAPVLQEKVEAPVPQEKVEAPLLQNSQCKYEVPNLDDILDIGERRVMSDFKNKRHSRSEFIEILKNSTDLVLHRLVNFLRLNKSYLDSGNPINFFTYLKEQEIDDDMFFFSKLLHNDIFLEKFDRELRKSSLMYTIMSSKKILVHSRSVIIR